MGVFVTHTNQTGLTLFFTLQQITDSGVLGNQWNANTAAWEASVSDADSKITMTEGTGRDIGSYVGGLTGTLESYTGDVVFRVHDDNDSDRVVGSGSFFFDAGSEKTIATVSVTTSSVTNVHESRTWKFFDGEGSMAPQVVTIPAGSTLTCAYDWSILNPNTEIQSVTSVTISTVKSGTAPTISSIAPSADGTQVHATFSNTVQGNYVTKAVMQTTDGQTFAGFGTLLVV